MTKLTRKPLLALLCSMLVAVGPSVATPTVTASTVITEGLDGNCACNAYYEGFDENWDPLGSPENHDYSTTVNYGGCAIRCVNWLEAWSAEVCNTYDFPNYHVFANYVFIDSQYREVTLIDSWGTNC